MKNIIKYGTLLMLTLGVASCSCSLEVTSEKESELDSTVEVISGPISHEETSSETTPPHEHIYGDFVESTFFMSGYVTHYCTICGYEKDDFIYKFELKDDESSYILRSVTYSQKYLDEHYTITDNDEYIWDEIAKPLIIPSEYNGLPVTQIGYPSSTLLFNCKQYISELIMPDTIDTMIECGDTVGRGGFYNCENLERVVLSNNLTALANTTFAECNKLETIEIPENVQSIGSGCFRNCKNLREVIWHPVYENAYIADYAFSNTTSLKDLSTISPQEGALIYLYRNAFYNMCVDTLTLTKNCFRQQSIGSGLSFSYGTFKELVYGLENFSNHSFASCNNLEKVIFTKDVTYIKDLQNLHYNSGFKSTELYYEGTVEEWNAIEKDADFNVWEHYVQDSNGNWNRVTDDKAITVVHCLGNDVNL